MLEATVVRFRRPPPVCRWRAQHGWRQTLLPCRSGPHLTPARKATAVVIATQKLQEAQRKIDDIRRELSQAQWDLNLWRQPASTGMAEGDRARPQVQDITQQLDRTAWI